MENVDFDKLLHDVIENPELLLDSSNISNEQILELQKRMNPYIGLTEPCDPEHKQVAACSYTNLREDYIRRFTMTSLVSFVFQMLHEYEVPKKVRTWVPETKESDTMFVASELKEQLEGMVHILNEVIETEKETDKLKKESLINENDKQQKDYDKQQKDYDKQVYHNEQKRVGLMFTLTQMLKDLGLKADDKLKVITTEAMKYPEIKKIIKTKQHVDKHFTEREMPNDVAKNIINTFLLNWFNFDPSIHIRSGLNKDVIRTEVTKVNNTDVVIDIDDPGHLTIEELRFRVQPLSQKDKDVLRVILSSKQHLNAVRNIIRDDNMHEIIEYVLDNIDVFKYYLLPVRDIESHIIPSQDTFHRWSYFTEVNYEEIRTITETLYPERPDLDWAIAIWTTFKGTDTEVDEQFTEYCQKHHDEMPSIMKLLEMGKWTLLADFKENRKNVQFYNKHTEVLKKIIDRHTEDKKIGTELMRNRVRQTKAKNIAEFGPDAPGLKTYKSTMSSEGKELSVKGVERVISPEEMKRLERAHGNIKAAKELEVLDEYDTLIRGLDDIKKYRELTQEERDKYAKAQEYIQRAKEMINVPDDAIQVDVFTTDTKTGEFIKSHFYTKCDEALDKEN